MPDDENLSPSDLFMKYNYPETKDMSKQFLTLVTTILVISLTFSEKIVGFSNATALAKWLIISSWICFLLAIIFCGLGLLFITIAAGKAALARVVDYSRAEKAYKLIVAAGVMFILGLLLLIGTAVTVTLG